MVWWDDPGQQLSSLPLTSHSSLPVGWEEKSGNQTKPKKVVVGQSEDRLISKEENCDKSKRCKSNSRPAQQQWCPAYLQEWLLQNFPPLVFLQSMMLCIMKYLSSHFRSAVPALPILECPGRKQSEKQMMSKHHAATAKTLSILLLTIFNTNVKHSTIWAAMKKIMKKINSTQWDPVHRGGKLPLAASSEHAAWVVVLNWFPYSLTASFPRSCHFLIDLPNLKNRQTKQTKKQQYSPAHLMPCPQLFSHLSVA